MSSMPPWSYTETAAHREKSTVVVPLHQDHLHQNRGRRLPLVAVSSTRHATDPIEPCSNILPAVSPLTAIAAIQPLATFGITTAAGTLHAVAVPSPTGAMIQGTTGESQGDENGAGGSIAVVSAKASQVSAIRCKESYPKRPLSAINLFFRLERERILQGQPVRPYTHVEVDHAADSANNDRESESSSSSKGKPKRRRHRKTNHTNPVGLLELTRMVNTNWSQLEDSQKAIFQSRAAVEKQAYAKRLDAWKATQPPPPPKKRRRMKLASTKHTACAEKNANELGASKSGTSLDTDHSQPAGPDSPLENLHTYTPSPLCHGKPTPLTIQDPNQIRAVARNDALPFLPADDETCHHRANWLSGNNPLPVAPINGGTSGSVIHLSHLTRLAEQPSVLEKRSDRPGLCDSIISSQDERQVDGLIDGEVGSNTGSFNECSQPDYSDLLLLSSQPYQDQLLTNYELGGTLSSDERFYKDHSRDIEIDTASMADCGRLPGATFP